MSTATEQNSAPEQHSSSGSQHHVEKQHPPSTQKDLADKIANVLLTAKPAFVKAAALVEQAQPYAEKAIVESKKVWTQLQPYHLDELFPVIAGLALVFCGGYFPTLLATVEAVRVSGSWPGIYSSWKALRSNYQAAQAASDKDNQDSSAKQLPPGALLHRKGIVLLKSINAEQVTEAAQKLGTALFAVLATLRLRLAAAFTLGASLSDAASAWGGGIATSAVAKALPDEARRLAPLLVNALLRGTGFLLAWAFARSAIAAYAALRGAQLLVEAGLDWGLRSQKLGKDNFVLQNKGAASAALALAGFAYQLYSGFTPFFLARLLLCPASLLELVSRVFFSLFF